MQEDRLADVIRLAETSMTVALGLDEESYLAALLRIGFSLQPTRRVREREARFREAWDLAQRLAMPGAIVEAGQGLARALQDLGRLAEAHQIAAQAMRLESRLKDAPRRWGNNLAILHSIELSLGDPAAAVRALRSDAEAEPDPHFRIGIHLSLAEWQARFGGAPRASEVEADLTAARSDAALARCPRCSGELSIVSAELLARIGRVEDARRELASWEQIAADGSALRELWLMRSKGAILMAEGDERAAAALLAPIADVLEHEGLLEELVWVRLDIGRALSRIDRAGSIEAFTAAAMLAGRIGAITEGRVANQALRGLGVRAWRRGRATGEAGLDSLSSREHEVARLVADGGSNREIAESLLVSPKTVERHITNVLAKLGLRNRTELAAVVRSTAVRGSPDE
jgi:DNA-binding CsgD family transcriptional regulator